MSNPLNIDFEVPFHMIYHFYTTGTIAHYPEYVDKFRELPEFVVYVINWRMKVFFVLTGFATLKTTVMVSFLVLRMFNALSAVKSRLSKNTIAKHKITLRSLVMQVGQDQASELGGRL
nr:protein B0454.3 [imported] - Caenorhabditis elegans [Caenorhabditis elegans]